MKMLKKIKAIDNFNKLPKQVKRTYYWMGVVFVAVLFMIYTLFSSAFSSDEVASASDDTPASARVDINTNEGQRSAEQPLDPAFEKTLIEEQNKNRTEAEETGASFAPKADLVDWNNKSKDSQEDYLMGVEIDKNIKEVVQAPVEEAVNKYRNLTKEQTVYFFENKKSAIATLHNKWGESTQLHHVSYTPVERTNESSSSANQNNTATNFSSSTSSQVAESNFKGLLPGDEFAVSFVFATNTDVTKEMVADILTGPFKGGKVTASVSLRNGFALYSSKYVRYQDKFFKAEGGVLIDSESEFNSAGFSDKTDWHTIYRYGSLFLGGLGAIPEMVLQDGTTSISVNGEVIAEETNYETKDYVIASVGEVGNKLGEVAKENFNRPETVYVDKHHMARLVFTEPVEVPWIKK